MVRFYSSAVLIAACLGGCVDSSRDTAEPDATSQAETTVDSVASSEAEVGVFDRTALMTNMTDNIFIPNYKAAATLADSFSADSGSLAAYCASIGGVDESTNLATAQGDWLLLMDSVQKTEMHIIGPAAQNDEALHNRVHSYSSATLASCALDQAVVESGSSGFQVTNRAFNQRGMGAIEYLLFNSNLDHSCSSQIASTASWGGLTEASRKIKRCGLARKLAMDVAVASNLIHDKWTEAAAPFRADFLNKESQGENFQLITDGMFYLETFTKSRKLTIPLGIDDKCSSVTCASLIESPYSLASLRNIRTNVAEFLRIFNGGDGLGFDDLIDAEDFEAITRRFQTQLSAVDSKLIQMSGSLSDHVALVERAGNDPACVNAFANPDGASSIDACSLAGLLKRVTDDLKIDFVAVVGVAIPGRVQSDND